MITSSMLAYSLKDLQKWCCSNADFQEGIQYGVCLGYKAGFNLGRKKNLIFKNFSRLLDIYISRPETFKKFDIDKYIC